MQLGYLTMGDLNRPVVDYLKNLDRSRLVEGADTITLADALTMRSGIRLIKEKVADFKDKPELLRGQRQVQVYLEASEPIPRAPREFKYQAADPALIMQILEVAVPGTAEDFIRKEFMGKMGITEYAWQEDTSGLPKSAAGSSFRSRDMLKIGMLIRNKGRWKGEQLIPQAFIERAVSPITLGWGTNYYGYFCWHRTLKQGEKEYPSIELRGALGQFIFILPEQDLIVVATAHGVMSMLQEIPARIIPAFTKSAIGYEE
jgi:CubicO group peptidase (beta-lactamase class C family)